MSNSIGTADYGDSATREMLKTQFDSLESLAQQFYSDIESLMSKGTDIIEAVCFWAEKNDCQVECCSEFILKNPAMLSKVQACAESLRFLKPVVRVKI